jgi:uncharacterized protein YegL
VSLRLSKIQILAPPTPQAVAAQLQEALVMAGMVSLRNDLAVEVGELWAFNWKTNVITIPLEELLNYPKAEICWIILHEAAHAALTRLHQILPLETLMRPEVQLLLNAVEDVRIENWLVHRYPGSVPWKQICDERAAQYAHHTPEQAAKEPPAIAFLRGVLLFGETAQISDALPSVVKEALEEVRPALKLAFNCVPPAAAVGAVSVNALYESHPVARRYRELDRVNEPSSFEKWVRIMQASMWVHVSERVLPVFMRLVKQFGCPSQPQSRTVVVTHGAPSQGKERSPAELKRALRAELTNGGSGRYMETVQKYTEQIRAITETLQLLLPNHRGLRHIRKCPSGDRLDLRVAAQFEADPRLHDQLWMQRRRRTLPDPAFVFVMDRSGSMQGDSKSTAAFESLVLLRETCERVGVPFSVIMFNRDPELIHDWEQRNDEAAQAALSAILHASGGTSIAAAMRCALKNIEHRPERDRFLFLMTDGSVGEREKYAVKKLKHEAALDGITIMAFGVGQEGDDIAEMFPEAELINHAEALPEALSRSLVRAIAAMQG